MFYLRLRRVGNFTTKMISKLCLQFELWGFLLQFNFVTEFPIIVRYVVCDGAPIRDVDHGYKARYAVE